MTCVYLERDCDRHIVSCRGHATGSTEMCAAVSCLLYTLAGWIHAFDVRHDTISLEDADALIVWYGGDDVFDLICAGFLQLQMTDPERVRTEIVAVS